MGLSFRVALAHHWMDAFTFLGDVAQQIPLRAPSVARHDGLEDDFHTISIIIPIVAFESQGHLNFSVLSICPAWHGLCCVELSDAH